MKHVLFLLLIFSSSLFAIQVTDQTPRAFSPNASVETAINVTFDKSVNTSLINNESIHVFGKKGGLLDGTVNVTNSGKTLEVFLTQSLIPGDRISVVVSNQLVAADGGILANGYNWEFDVENLQGLPGFSQIQTKLAYGLTAVASADFDGDGTADIAVAGNDGTTYYIQLFYFQNNFIKAGEKIEVPHYIRPLIVGDLNNDGTSDLIAINRFNESFASYFVSNGTISFGAEYSTGKNGTEPRSGSIIDLDNDGWLDLALVKRVKNSSDDKTALVFLNNGNGVLGLNGRETDWFWKESVAELLLASDLNLDGSADIVTSVQGARGGISYFVNPGNGWLFPDEPDLVYNIPSDLESAVAADFSGNELPDLIAADISTNQVFPFFNTAISDGLPQFVIRPPMLVLEGSNWVDYADFDADGDLDIVVNGGVPKVQVISNNGNGFFASPVSYDFDTPVKMTATADINGDGAGDILVAGEDGTLGVLINNANGNTAPETPIPVAPADGEFLATQNVELTWQIPVDEDENLLHFILQITNKDGSQATQTFSSLENPELFSPNPPVSQNSGNMKFQFSAPSEGSYSWQVRAFDGITSSSFSNLRSFSVDFKPPENLALTLPGGLFDGHWFNPSQTPSVPIYLNYSEANPVSAQLRIMPVGDLFTNTNLQGGINQQTTFNVNIDGYDEGQYPLSGILSDAAGFSDSTASFLGIDKNPPSGTVAIGRNDTSTTTSFTIAWGGGTDGNGSGLSGKYRINVQVDDGPWVLWLDNASDTMAVFNGQDLHKYSFEAAAIDNIGLMETLTGTVEATVYVDRTANDVDPPTAPEKMTVNGVEGANPWQSGTEYEINWQNPVDEVEIIASYWKLGNPPTSNADYQKEDVPSGPIKVQAEGQDGVPFYMWLKDRKGNVDYRNFGVVLLRRDVTNPVIHGFALDHVPHFQDGDNRRWFNSNLIQNVNLELTYTEMHTNQAILQTDGLSENVVNQNNPSGTNVKTYLPLLWNEAQTGSYDMVASVSDSVGLTGQTAVPLGLDGEPPTGSKATSVDVSETESFSVQWSPGNDGTGSGIAGQYDVYVKTDDGNWQQWLDNEFGTSAIFTGQHGRRYDFQALAVDYVGNVELLNGSETSTLVDTTADDIAAPPSPLSLSAGGVVGESPWQKDSTFVIDWENPFDESGIAGSFWKLGEAPRSNDDYDSNGPVNGPISVLFNGEGGQWLYLWLEDTKGNVDYRNSSKVLLRRNLEPVIEDLRFTNPNAFYVDDENRSWYDQTQDNVITIQLTYSEIQTDSIIIRNNGSDVIYKNTSPGNGENVILRYSYSVKDYVDGKYTITAIIYDIAGLTDSQTIKLGLDSTAPHDAIATSPSMSTQDRFLVSWSKGVDEGSGLSGKYRVYYQDNGSSWKILLNETNEQSVEFFGQDGHEYSFETITWDNLQHQEIRTQTAETITKVDLSAGDSEPPGSPINLLANGSSPSPWRNSSTFSLTWTNPQDLSGIAKSYYKFGAPPTSNTDINGIGPATGLLDVKTSTENGQFVYLWLEDSNGNVDYRNNTSVLLRFDKSKPEFTNKRFLRPMYNRNWYDQTEMAVVDFRMDYRERHADSVIVTIQEFAVKKVYPNPESGLDVKLIVPLDVADEVDGTGLVRFSVVDSAGNRAVMVDTLHLDSRPPANTKAQAPELSSSSKFLVNWTEGEDGGVGVSGFYDIYVNENELGWSLWQQKINSRSAEFTGTHNHSYQFEVLAYDFLDHLEKRLSFAEATTFVDTTASDTLAPGKPPHVNVDGQNPSPWQTSKMFNVYWDNVEDPTGITKSFFKLGSPPTSNEDFTGTGNGTPPLTIDVENEDGQWCHIWLADGNENIDFRNHSSILLQWDETVPTLDSLVLANPAFEHNWYNPKVQSETGFNVYFTELHPDSIFVNAPAPLEINPPATYLNGERISAFTIIFPDSADTTFSLNVAVKDSAGNRAIDSTTLALDSKPPFGTVANSPDTTGPGEFTVTWAGVQSDGNGSGLSGEYYVKIKIDDGDWEPWNPRINATQATYVGEAGHSYAFEAAAYDNVGNLEPFTGTPETQTIVRLNFWDKEAPGSPIDLRANGSNPSAWSNDPGFSLTWVEPDDPSGIAKSYFKIGSPPTGNNDFTGVGEGTPPITLTVGNDGSHNLYLWLEDGNGNKDFTTAEHVVLSYDGTVPVIDSVFVANANYSQKWINPDSTDSAVVRVFYSEIYPDTLFLNTGSIFGQLFKNNMEKGTHVFSDFTFPIEELGEGCYRLVPQLRDSAGNVTKDSLLLCVDETAPDSAFAVSPEVSRTQEFTISWANEGKGTDGAGSGLSGEYDVKIRIDGGAWFDIAKREKRTSIKYVGHQGAMYGFEVAAWDNVGNREPFRGIAESNTVVDTNFIDITPPGPPIEVQVNGENPSPWQNAPEFEISWQNPVDESGIALVYYKFDSPPESENDTSGTVQLVDSAGSILLSIPGVGVQDVYIWLGDGKGNADYHNYSSVLLQYDSVAPVIDSLQAVAPGFLENWYNQKEINSFAIRFYFQEEHPLYFSLANSDYGESKIKFDPDIHQDNFADIQFSTENIKDGSAMFTGLLADSAGNKSRFDSIRINFDSVPPSIKHTMSDTLVDEGGIYQVVATVTDLNRTESVKVQYWRGGQISKPDSAMTQINDSTFVLEIPAEFITSRGLEYAIIANDGLNKNRLPHWESKPSSFAVRVRITGENNTGLERNQALAIGDNIDAYRMISFPIEIYEKSADAIFSDNLGSYDPGRWRLFEWNSAESQFNEYPKISSIKPGKAFWLISNLKDIFLDTGPGMSVNTSEPFLILLKKGWNDIGNPFNFSVAWDDIFLTSAADTSQIIGPYSFDGSWTFGPQVETMNPWEGYSIYTESENITLLIPPKIANTQLGKKSPLPGYNDIVWALSLKVSNELVADKANFIGTAENASDKFDYGYDYVEPHPIGSHLSLYFDRPDWDMQAERFTSDFRAPQDGHIWEFDVTGTANKQPVELSVSQLTKIPPTLSLHLVDIAAGYSVDLQRDSTYTFLLTGKNKSRRFKIIAGSDKFLKDHKEELKTVNSFGLVQNYPNPFNGGTTIQYNLDKTTDISLSIYNLLGQKVRTIYSGLKEMGVHQFHWDAKDDAGKDLGTGIYILKMQTPQMVMTKKMIYMR